MNIPHCGRHSSSYSIFSAPIFLIRTFKLGSINMPFPLTPGERVKLCHAFRKFDCDELYPAKDVRGFSFRYFLVGVVLAALLVFPSVLFAQAREVDDVDKGGSEATLAVETDAVSANPVLPPKWAFGVLFASYRNQADTLDAMRRLRSEYCGDLMWIDSSWLWGAYDRADRYICFEFDTNQFSDAKTMIAT